MKFKVIIPLFLLVMVAACNKDKFNTRPDLRIKSVNQTKVDINDEFKITLEVTDAEGDISDSAFVQKIVPRCPQGNLTVKTTVPDFPSNKNFKGEILITYGYRVANVAQLPEPQCNRNDTCTFRIWIKDKAGNVSDTVETEKIVIIKH